MAAFCMLPITFAVSAAARVQLDASKLTSEPAWRTFQSSEASNSKHILRAPELANGTILPVLPFIVGDAEVTGDAGGEDTAGGWAKSTRALLHGKRRPSKYSRCPTCTLISCNGVTGVCSGHCKRKSKLFTCQRDGLEDIRSPCFDDLPEISNLPADTLGPLRSVAVAATAPFIGCANITGLPSGCPAEGTWGESADGQMFTVLDSSCQQYRYSIKQCERGFHPVTPFYPFGYCECATRSNVGVIGKAACLLSELSYTAPDAAETGGVPVRVVPEGNMTMTTYGVREELDQNRFQYDAVLNSSGPAVAVEMRVWDALLNDVLNITLDGLVEQSR